VEFFQDTRGALITEFIFSFRRLKSKFMTNQPNILTDSNTDQRKQYKERVKAEIDKLDARIDEFRAKVDQLEADGKLKYNNILEEMTAKRDAAQQKFESLQEAGESAWGDLQKGFENAWEDLDQSFQKALKNF
jgi:uncharacterized protein YlxW (UPF0749 family)